MRPALKCGSGEHQAGGTRYILRARASQASAVGSTAFPRGRSSTARLPRQSAQSTASPIPEPWIEKVASPSARQGESKILQMRFSPRPFLSISLVVDACAMMLPPMGLEVAIGPPSTCATTWLVTADRRAQHVRRGRGILWIDGSSRARHTHARDAVLIRQLRESSQELGEVDLPSGELASA